MEGPQKFFNLKITTDDNDGTKGRLISQEYVSFLFHFINRLLRNTLMCRKTTPQNAHLERARFTTRICHRCFMYSEFSSQKRGACSASNSWTAFTIDDFPKIPGDIASSRSC